MRCDDMDFVFVSFTLRAVTWEHIATSISIYIYSRLVNVQRYVVVHCGISIEEKKATCSLTLYILSVLKSTALYKRLCHFNATISHYTKQVMNRK